MTINGSTTSSGTTSSFSCTYNKSSGSISGTSGCSSVVDALKLYEQYATSKTKQSQAQAAVSAQVNRTATQMTVSMIERRISASLSPAFAAAFRPGSADDKKKQKLSDASGVRSTYEDGIAGISAGDSGYTKGLWATYSHGWVSNDWDAQKSNSELDTGIIGADIRINERFLAGLSLTYVRTNSNNTFEDGVSDANGFTVIPYAAMGLMDGKLVLDIMTGYGTGDTGGTRARSTNASRSYSYDSDRWMLSTNATLNNTWNNFVFSEKLGWMMSYDWTGAYTDSASTAFAQQVTRIGEISLGARAGYTGWERFEPYAGVTLAIDPLNDPDNVGSTGKRLDNKEVLGLIGLNWMPTERLTTGIEVTNSFFREKQNSTTIAINGRFAF
ncbi:MAG: autotransporter outer membrane beta-barrel domain-containing protein [Rhodospirillaceae bacterium]